MKKVIGYQWYINFGCHQYVPQEHTYATIEETENAIAEYLDGSPIPLSACGIDKVENDDGFIEVLEQVIIPTTCFWRE
jgi:hypothetical protein